MKYYVFINILCLDNLPIQFETNSCLTNKTISYITVDKIWQENDRTYFAIIMENRIN